MRFRSLVIDYKAEALQVLREDKKDDDIPQRIRILSPPEREPEATPSVTTDSPRHLELPFWLTLPKNQAENVAITNAVVTPIGKLEAVDIDNNSMIGDDDDEDDPMEISERNHCNRGNDRQELKIRETRTRRIFDYRVFFANPWLLELVSSIRRRANRKRIANQAWKAQHLYTSYYTDYRQCPNDSFSRTLWSGQFYIRNTSWRAGWNRLSRIDGSSKLSDRNEWETAESPLLALVHNRKGNFGSLLPPQSQPSNALVVFRGTSSTESIDAKKKNSPSLSLRVWETAILAAAALCAHQQKQKKEQNKEMTMVHEGELLENECSHDERAFHMLPIQGNDKKDECKDEPPISVHDRYREIRFELNSRRKNIQNGPHKHNKHSRFPCVEKKVASEIYRSRTATVRKKRHLLPPRLEEDEVASLSRKRPREGGQSNIKFDEGSNAAKDLEEMHNLDTYPSAASNPRNSKQKQKPKPTRKEDIRKKNELFLLQRFGLLPRKMNENDSESSMMSVAKSHSTKRNDDEKMQEQNDSDTHPCKSKDATVKETEDCNGGTGKYDKDGDEHLLETSHTENDAPSSNVDYSSPIEFPVCFDDYEDEDEQEQEEDVNRNISVASEAKEGKDTLTAVNTANLTTQPSEMEIDCYEEKCEDRNNVDGIIIGQHEAKAEARPYLDLNPTHPTTESSGTKKRDKKKRRKRTPEEKLLRKKNKKRRKKKKKTDNCELTTEPVDCMKEDEREKEGDKLETPRKIDFKKFSPVKTSKQETTMNNPPNASGDKFSTPVSTRRISFQKCGSNDKISQSSRNDAKASISTLKPRKLSDEPFSISPKENISCPDPVARRLLYHKEKEYNNTTTENPISGVQDSLLQTTTYPGPFAHTQHEKKAPHTASICLLCSEAFIENFGDAISNITRGEGNNQTPIRFIDTDLVDLCSVDIETPYRGAIVVSTPSQIQNSGNIMLQRIVSLVSTNRYHSVVVFVCVDMTMDSAASQAIVRLQSAFLSCERGLPRTQTSIQLCSKRSLGACISRTIFRSIESPNSLFSDSLSRVEHWLSDSRACQRLRFLLSIIPALSVTGALHWLDMSVDRSTWSPLRIQRQDSKEDKTSEWFQQCFRDAHSESRKLESHLLRSNTNRTIRKSKLSDFINPVVAKQLVWVVDARLKQF